MQINAILKQDRIKANIEGGSKKRVIEMIARTFSESIESFDLDELYQNLISREKLGTTGIGGGIAIPHCRFNTNGDTYGVCLTLDSPIDFDSVDNEPVDIIFAMLVPENAESDHLAMLAQLAEQLQTGDFVSKLRSAKDNEALESILLN
ncbi:MAG: PTS sugar transporter subunit IIA [Agarilytica sp.]